MPVYIGLDLGGTAKARIVYAPDATPAPPTYDRKLECYFLWAGTEASDLPLQWHARR